MRPELHEIIGWRRVDNSKAAPAWQGPPWIDGAGNGHLSIEADDLLAWLDAKGYAIEITSARNEGERDIFGELRRYRRPIDSEDRYGGGFWERDADFEFDGVTLAAALEAAVRLVHGATR